MNTINVTPSDRISPSNRPDLCPDCGCTARWQDISAPSPIEDWCSEPQRWRITDFKCWCHSPAYIEGWLSAS